jgi:hypothetical protein
VLLRQSDPHCDAIQQVLAANQDDAVFDFFIASHG